MPKQKKEKTKPEQWLRKARQWVLTYTGSHIVRAYLKRLKVNVSCALNNLKTIGALSQEKLETLKCAEGIRLQQKQKERRLKREQTFNNRFPDLDDTFYFIAGYTRRCPPTALRGMKWGWSLMHPPDDIESSQMLAELC